MLLLFVMIGWCSIVYTCHVFFIHSSADWHLGWICNLASMNNTWTWMSGYCCCLLTLIRYIHKSIPQNAVESHDSSTFSFSDTSYFSVFCKLNILHLSVVLTCIEISCVSALHFPCAYECTNYSSARLLTSSFAPLTVHILGSLCIVYINPCEMNCWWRIALLYMLVIGSFAIHNLFKLM